MGEEGNEKDWKEGIKDQDGKRELEGQGDKGKEWEGNIMLEGKVW